MRRATRIAAIAATLAAVAVGAPFAGADTTWTKVSTDYNANIVVPSLGLVGTTAVVAWTQQTSPSTQRHRHRQLHDLADAGRDRRRGQQGRDGVGVARLHPRALPAARRRPAAGLRGHPLDQLRRSADRAAHDTPQRRRHLGSAVRRLGRRAAAPWTAVPAARFRWSRASGTGASSSSTAPWLTRPARPTRTCSRSSAAAAAISRSSRSTARATSGSRGTRTRRAPRACTCSSSTPRQRRRSARPRTRPTARASTTTASASALACAATCRLVYGNSPAAGPTDTIVSWWPGQGAPTTIANLAGTGQGAGRVLTAAYRADGRLWVAWFDGKTYRATLGDATGAGGEVQDAGVPKGAANGAYALAGMAVGDNLLLAANYAWNATARRCRSRSSSTRSHRRPR